MKLKKCIFYVIISTIFIFSLYIFSINLPEAFGKKQFIIGVDTQEIVKRAAITTNIKSVKPSEGIRQILFAPDDDILAVLIELIAKEKKSIRLAAFLLTDQQVANALLEAKARGVEVEIIFDQKSVKSRGCVKIAKSLAKKGIRIFVYKPLEDKKLSSNKTFNLSNLMHNKFIIFSDNTMLQKSLVWTGSFNFTYSARKTNQENVIILDDAYAVQKFTERFDYLKNKFCYRYT